MMAARSVKLATTSTMANAKLVVALSVAASNAVPQMYALNVPQSTLQLTMGNVSVDWASLISTQILTQAPANAKMATL